MFAIALICVLLIVLAAPSWLVLVRFGQLTAMQALRKAWPTWIGLVVVAVGLIYSADAIGLTNPLGYVFGICFVLGMSGAGFFFLAKPRTLLGRLPTRSGPGRPKMKRVAKGGGG